MVLLGLGGLYIQHADEAHSAANSASLLIHATTLILSFAAYVQENYPHPVNDWAIQEAEGSMDKIGALKKKGLPIDKIHHQIKVYVSATYHTICITVVR